MLQWVSEVEISSSSKNQGEPHEGSNFYSGLQSSDV